MTFETNDNYSIRFEMKKNAIRTSLITVWFLWWYGLNACCYRLQRPYLKRWTTAWIACQGCVKSMLPWNTSQQSIWNSLSHRSDCSTDSPSYLQALLTHSGSDCPWNCASLQIYTRICLPPIHTNPYGVMLMIMDCTKCCHHCLKILWHDIPPNPVDQIMCDAIMFCLFSVSNSL